MVDPIDDDAHIAPVIPLFGAESPAEPAWRSTWHDGSSDSRAGTERAGAAERPGDADTRTVPPRLRALHHPALDGDGDGDSRAEPDPDSVAERASETLVRKLRARSMSVAEATTFLRGQQVPAERIEMIIDEFCSRKYLDDAMLAGHLVTAGHERKGQGRVALARVLSQRGIPREVADAALAELPDDDFDRALEFARSKMRSLARLDSDTAKRRLYGQLQRRGYSGGLVSEVVRQAIDESFSRGGSSGVRFE